MGRRNASAGMVKEAERLERRQREESILDKSGARKPRQQAASRLLGRVVAHSSMKDLFWNYHRVCSSCVASSASRASRRGTRSRRRRKVDVQP